MAQNSNLSRNQSKDSARDARYDDQDLPDKIGSSLKSLYNEVLNEDVPEDFLALLKKADDEQADDEQDERKGTSK